MAKLYFTYASMGSGKSSSLLQVRYNYQERDMDCLLLTAAIDTRFGENLIASRLGISAPAETFTPTDDLFSKFLVPARERGVAAVLIDEIQFATPEQIWQLARGVDELDLPVMCYGLRSDFRGTPFPGSAALMAIADEVREMRTICKCGAKATMVLRLDATGTPTLDGEQVQVGDSSYVSLCRKHWMEAHSLISAP